MTSFETGFMKNIRNQKEKTRKLLQEMDNDINKRLKKAYPNLDPKKEKNILKMKNIIRIFLGIISKENALRERKQRMIMKAEMKKLEKMSKECNKVLNGINYI